MAVDLRQILAGFLTLTMFFMLVNMIKRDHFESLTPLRTTTNKIVTESGSGLWNKNDLPLRPCWSKLQPKEKGKGYITLTLINGPHYHLSQIGRCSSCCEISGSNFAGPRYPRKQLKRKEEAYENGRPLHDRWAHGGREGREEMTIALFLPQCSLPFSTLASRSITTTPKPNSATPSLLGCCSRQEVRGSLRFQHSLLSRRGPCTSSASSTHSPSSTTSLRSPLQIPDTLRLEIDSFDPKIPLDEAHTPPSSWYTDPSFHDIEFDRVFYRGWQAVGYVEQVALPHDFFTGRLGSIQFVITRDTNGHLHAFHNVCRHHASLLATGCGRKSCFVCPYHGWTYGLDGGLLKATQISGIKNFHLHEFGLLPINLATWGPFVLLNFNQQLGYEESKGETISKDWLGSCSDILMVGGINHSLKHVFCDNYLDGGYHVPYAHGALAAGLKLESYSTMVYERVSIQRCESMQIESGDDFDRLGSKALYAFIYPNFMINRYGPWMDTNLVIPTGPSKCQVIFDYFLESCSKVDETFIRRSLEESERVQMEDITLCEGVQKGLESQAYFSGRYAPTLENAMHHFHCLLHESFTAD